VVHAGDLQEGDGTVGERTITDPWSLPLVATLGEALEALHELRVPGLLVVDADMELVSLVCTSHLRRLGVPADVLRR
jgi:CBS domain-containing protein